MVSLTVAIILACGARLSDSGHAVKTSQAKMTPAVWGRDPAFFCISWSLGKRSDATRVFQLTYIPNISWF